MAAWSKIPHPKKRAMLAALAETGNVTRAAEIAEIDRCQHYHWLERDPKYAEFAPIAMEMAGDRLEQEARRRAVEGVAEPVFYQGQPCGVVQRYSDTLLIFLLKGAKPDRYADRLKQEMTGDVQVIWTMPQPRGKDDGD